MKSISYALTACNEHEELTVLLNKLFPYVDKQHDEIVIQIDADKVTPEVNKVINTFINDHVNGSPNFKNFRVHSQKLNGDFAAFKNALKDKCSCDFIFFIDADEIPSSTLLQHIHQILEENDIDVIRIPRVNIVEGLTQEHISKWGWIVDERNRVNWPDFQGRICRNKLEIVWEGKVHERLVGWRTESNFPLEEEWALLHIKSIARQEKQNSFYNTI